MDPSVAHAISEVLGPFLGVLACGAIPVTLVFLSKHFKLRTKELELEAELHGRDSQARLQAMETRLASLDAKLGAFRLVLRDRALAQAKAAQIALQAGVDLGVLHGLPWAAKDLFDVKGYPTTAGTHLLADAIAREDAFVVRRLDHAGM